MLHVPISSSHNLVHLLRDREISGSPLITRQLAQCGIQCGINGLIADELKNTISPKILFKRLLHIQKEATQPHSILNESIDLFKEKNLRKGQAIITISLTDFWTGTQSYIVQNRAVSNNAELLLFFAWHKALARKQEPQATALIPFLISLGTKLNREEEIRIPLENGPYYN